MSLSGVPMNQWATAIAAAIGAPDTNVNQQFMAQWHNCEASGATFNPFNTTQPMPGSTIYNSFRVQNYVSFQQGVDATRITLENGFYPDLIAGLRSGNPGCTAGVTANLRTWGTDPNCLCSQFPAGAPGPAPPQGCGTGIVPVGCTSGVFAQGSSGQCVSVIQQALNCVILAGLATDGQFGPATANAVRTYQGSHGLAVDGVVGPNTWQALVTSLANGEAAPIGGPAPGQAGGTCESQTLQVGSNGTCVSTLQAGLNQLIGCGLSVDGQFGPATDGCVRRFQGTCNLGQDGIVGPQTWGCFDQRLGAAGGSVSPGGGGPPVGGLGGGATTSDLFGVLFPPQAKDVAELVNPGTPYAGQTEGNVVADFRGTFRRDALKTIVDAINNAMRGR